MREILFKAKRVDGKGWIEGLLTIMWGQYHIIKPSDENIAYPIKSETICECTGLEDKEGNKIWEHDLLKYSCEYPGSPWLKAKGLTDDDIRYDVGEVFFSEWRGTWSVCGRGRSRGMNQDVYKYSRNPNRTRVVGNVFDNPELIEK